MAETTTFSGDSLEGVVQVFNSASPKSTSTKRRSYRAKPTPSRTARSPSTTATTTSESTGHYSRKCKSSTSSRSSVSPDPGSGSTSHSGILSGRRRFMLAVPPKKTTHNMIEKRYRSNLNDKIAALRDSVPSLRVMVRRPEQQSSEDGDEGMAPTHKPNKATVLSKATEYITYLEGRNKSLAKENTAMRSRVEGLKTMVEKAGEGTPL